MHGDMEATLGHKSRRACHRGASLPGLEDSKLSPVLCSCRAAAALESATDCRCVQPPGSSAGPLLADGELPAALALIVPETHDVIALSLTGSDDVILYNGCSRCGAKTVTQSLPLSVYLPALPIRRLTWLSATMVCSAASSTPSWHPCEPYSWESSCTAPPTSATPGHPAAGA